MLEVALATLVVAAILRLRARRRMVLMAQALFADTERRVWGRSQTVAILDAMLPTTHPYARKSAANIYRYFDRWKTLDELEEEYPPGPSWRAQFRFDRPCVVIIACMCASQHHGPARALIPKSTPCVTHTNTGTLRSWPSCCSTTRGALKETRRRRTASMPSLCSSTTWRGPSVSSATWKPCGTSRGDLYQSTLM